MQLMVGADVVATPKNINYFRQGNMKAVVGEEIFKLLQQSDYRIFNIEAPITNFESPIKKCGVCLRMDEDVLPGLVNINPSLVTLANNHILDHGVQGLLRTCEILRHNKIPFVGVGTIHEAEKPVFLEKDGLKIGVYACAEHEFSIAGDRYDEEVGANPFDPLESFDHIIEAKRQCHFLIVLYHGGREFYRYPSPYIQKLFRKMAQKGADLVIAQHTHCIGCYEEYNGSTLVYGQGNFIFDNEEDEYWNSGMLVNLNIQKDSYDIDFIPFVKKNGTIEMAKDSLRQDILEAFAQRSEEVVNAEIVRKRYEEYMNYNLENALRVLHGNAFLFRVVNKFIGGGLIYKIYKNEEQLLSLLNYIECEAHRELIIAGIKKKIPKERL